MTLNLTKDEVNILAICVDQWLVQAIKDKASDSVKEALTRILVKVECLNHA